MKLIQLKNDTIEVKLLPLGAKIVSLVFESAELLYTKPFNSYNPKPGDTFDEKVAWGGDICFPSVAKTTLKLENSIYEIQDHGNFWTKEFEIVEQQIDSVKIQANDGFFELIFEVKLQDNQIIRNYAFKNISSHPLPFVFADHLLLPINWGMEARDYIHIPDCEKMLVEYSYGEHFKKGEWIDWRQNRKQPFADKLFGKLTKNKNKKFSFSYDRILKNKKINLEFSSPDFPYIGYWHTEGGWNNESNLGLEFTNGMFDDAKMLSEEKSFLNPEERSQYSINLKLIVC